MSQVPDPEVINRGMLEELLDLLGAEGLDEVIDQFEMDALAALDALERLIAAPDDLKLRQVGHKVKGLYAQVGLDALAAVAADMEVLAGPGLVERAKVIVADSPGAIAAARALAAQVAARR